MFLGLLVVFAGLLSVLAPCVLPVLPVILAGSIGERSWRVPAIIIASLAVSITVFTGLLKASTLFIMVPPGFWTYLSAGLVTFLGLTYLFPLAWARVTDAFGLDRGSHDALSRVQDVRNSNLRLVLTGMALGPVFSSCSPTYSLLLASIFPASFALGMAYTALYALSFGAGLFIIALGGQAIVKRLRFLADSGGTFRKILGAIFVLVGIIIATGASARIESALIAQFNINNAEGSLLDRYIAASGAGFARDGGSVANSPMPNAPSLTFPNGMEAPEIPTADTIWINSKPLSLASLRGKVVLIDFWTYSCINCQRTIPYLTAWDAKYRDQGLVIIGAHAPEFSFEKIRDNVAKAVEEDAIRYPVVLDNDFALWRAYHNSYWPAKYFIDRNGKLRHYHFGEGAYAESEKVIQYLLSEWNGGTTSSGTVEVVTDMRAGEAQSPETYLGMSRRDRLRMWADQKDLLQNEWTLTGSWVTDEESVTAWENARLLYRYNARDVYLVLSGSWYVTATVDGRDANILGILWEKSDTQGRIHVDANRLYHLIHTEKFQPNSLLELRLSEGVRAFAFTFGS